MLFTFIEGYISISSWKDVSTENGVITQKIDE